MFYYLLFPFLTNLQHPAKQADLRRMEQTTPSTRRRFLLLLLLMMGGLALHLVLSASKNNVVSVDLGMKMPVVESFGVNGKKNSIDPRKSSSIDSMAQVSGGHWEYVEQCKDSSAENCATPPYIFSPQVCDASTLGGDCKKTKTCPSNLMNWVYFDNNNKRYPRFDVGGFRRAMRNKRILFVGCSLMRQQVLALVWTLGHNAVKWNVTKPLTSDSCTSERKCMVDKLSNITICWQFLGTMATRLPSR